MNFKPGPFYMGDGLLGWAANVNCIVWTLFVCVIFSLPNYLPVTADNMNYASVRLFLLPSPCTEYRRRRRRGNVPNEKLVCQVVDDDGVACRVSTGN